MTRPADRIRVLAEYDDMYATIQDGDVPYTTEGLQDLIFRLLDADCINAAAALAGEHNKRYADEDGSNAVHLRRLGEVVRPLGGSTEQRGNG